MQFIGFLFLAVCLSVGSALVAGWAFMIAVGIIHAQWIVALPTIGFGWSVVIVWLLSVPLMIYSAANSSSN